MSESIESAVANSVAIAGTLIGSFTILFFVLWILTGNTDAIIAWGAAKIETAVYLAVLGALGLGMLGSIGIFLLKHLADQ